MILNLFFCRVLVDYIFDKSFTNQGISRSYTDHVAPYTSRFSKASYRYTTYQSALFLLPNYVTPKHSNIIPTKYIRLNIRQRNDRIGSPYLSLSLYIYIMQDYKNNQLNFYFTHVWFTESHAGYQWTLMKWHFSSKFDFESKTLHKNKND